MANNISILDSSAAAQVVKTTDNASVHTPHHNVDTCTVVTSLSQFGGQAINLGAGAVGTGTLRITLASDDPAVADLAAIETLLGTIDTDTGTIATAASAIQTSVQLLDDAVFADDAAFTLASSKTLVAGAIRDDALSTLAAVEGDVVPLRVSSTGALHVTGGGGGTEYTEDAAAPADPTGSAPILVRADTPATVTSADGDLIAQRATNYGAAFVQLLTSSGSFIDSVGGGTQFAEDSALGSTPTGTLAMARRDDALSTLTPAEDDAVGLRVNSTGALWVIPSGTVTVAGTGTFAVQAAQSGTWNVGTVTTVSTVTAVTTVSTVTNLAQFAGNAIATNNGTASAGTLRVTIASNSTGVVGATQSGTWNITNISGTISLPTGAATAANQSTHTTHLSNIATAAQLIDNTIFVDDAAFTPASSSVSAIGFLFDDVTPDSVDEGDIGIGRMSANRCQYVQVRDAAGNERGLNIDASGRITVTGSVSISGTTSISDAGSSITVDANELTTLAGAVSGSEMQVDVVGSIPAGTNAIGDVGLIPRTSGGLTVSKTVSAATTNATSVKASAGQVFWIYASNLNAAARYLKLYNKASAPTVGTDTPVLTLLIPGNTAGAAFQIQTPIGFAFGTGIAFALTTGVADSDTGAVAANELVVNIGYA